MLKIRYTLPSILVILLIRSVCLAADFYVDVAIGNDTNSGTLSKPWKTITKANYTLKAGDTVYLRGGSYRGQQIAPKNSGTASSKINYKNYNNEKVTITETSSPLVLSNRKYIRVLGTATQNIVIINCDNFLRMGDAHHNELAYLTITKMRKWPGSKGFWVGGSSTYNWIHHCTISKFGYYSSSNDYGDMVYIGASPANGNSSNLVEDCHIYHSGHIPLKVSGKWNVIRNNYIHGEEWYPLENPKYGNRAAAIIDYHDNPINGWNLIERNRFGFTGIPSDASYSDGIQHNNHDCIIRNNMFYACKGQGLKIAATKTSYNVDDNYIYNNVFFYNGIGGVSMSYQNAIWLRANSWDVDHTVIKNNIFYKNPNNIKNSGKVTNSVVVNNWIAGNPQFLDAVPEKTIDPFNQNYPDFNLQATSPCIDSGAFLSKTTSAGRGKRIQVEDAHYFMDGWGMEQLGVYGDIIQLEGQTETARIVDIDYSNNILTIDKSLTWTSNKGISLKYNGTAPDLGAFEFNFKGTVMQSPKNLRIIGYNN